MYDPVEPFFILWIVILGGMLRTCTGSVSLQLHSYTWVGVFMLQMITPWSFLHLTE